MSLSYLYTLPPPTKGGRVHTIYSRVHSRRARDQSLRGSLVVVVIVVVVVIAALDVNVVSQGGGRSVKSHATVMLRDVCMYVLSTFVLLEVWSATYMP
jgi:hypothetical protein